MKIQVNVVDPTEVLGFDFPSVLWTVTFKVIQFYEKHFVLEKYKVKYDCTCVQTSKLEVIAYLR